MCGAEGPWRCWISPTQAIGFPGFSGTMSGSGDCAGLEAAAKGLPAISDWNGLPDRIFLTASNGFGPPPPIPANGLSSSRRRGERQLLDRRRPRRDRELRDGDPRVAAEVLLVDAALVRRPGRPVRAAPAHPVGDLRVRQRVEQVLVRLQPVLPRRAGPIAPSMLIWKRP